VRETPAFESCENGAKAVTWEATKTRFDDRYRGVFGRRDLVFMSAGDMATRGLADGDLVDLEACSS